MGSFLGKFITEDDRGSSVRDLVCASCDVDQNSGGVIKEL